VNVSVNPRSHPHLERGALTIGATAALFAVWFGIGLPGVPFAVPGLASGTNEAPSTTELYARAPAVARAYGRVATSTGTRRRTRTISTSQLTLPIAPGAPVVRAAPPSSRGGTTTTERTSTSSPKNDPQHATDGEPPARPQQPAPPPAPPTVDDGVTAVTSVVETTVNTEESAVPAVLSAADAVQTLLPTPPSLLPGSTKPKLPGLP